ncbi:Retrotransposon-derived protein PEG10, partial [Smittium mucronatum]
MINQANENPAPLNQKPGITNPTQNVVLTAPGIIPDGTLKLPEAVRFDDSPPNYQAFMSSMGLYFGHAPKSSTTTEIDSPSLTSFSLLHEEFSRNFSDPSNAIRARGLIRKLRQGTRSVATYAAKFRTLARDSGYDQLALVDQFLRGLNDNVMNFMIMNDLPNDLEGNISIAIRVDNRLASHSMLRQGNPDFSPR